MRLVKCMALAVAILLAASCKDARGPMETELYHWADSTACALMTMDAELPSGPGKVAENVRVELADVIDGILGYITSYENERMVPAYDGDMSDPKAMLEHYRDGAFGVISRLAQDDADERKGYILEDEDFTDEQKAELLESFPRWEYEFSLQKMDETDRYVVFRSMDYVYMGGAHGGVTGAGCLTFSKKDGSRVADFVDASGAAGMQLLLIKGLLDYYAECGYETTWEDLKDGLFIENGFIPLPSWPLYPTDSGLGFIYQQYEIASYAEGMPSFVVPYSDIEPFLTPEARSLLGL